MTGTFSYPNMNGSTQAEQLAQLKSWLFRLTDQLNLALGAVGGNAPVPGAATAAVSGGDGGEKPFGKGDRRESDPLLRTQGLFSRRS